MMARRAPTPAELTGWQRRHARREARRAANRAAFVEAAIERHGAAYDYTDVQYRDHLTPIVLWCRRHEGVVYTTPKRHLTTAHGGCQQCLTEARSAPRSRPADEASSMHKKITHPVTGVTRPLWEWAAYRGLTAPAMDYRVKNWPDLSEALDTGEHRAYHKREIGHD